MHARTRAHISTHAPTSRPVLDSVPAVERRTYPQLGAPVAAHGSGPLLRCDSVSPNRRSPRDAAAVTHAHLRDTPAVCPSVRVCRSTTAEEAVARGASTQRGFCHRQEMLRLCDSSRAGPRLRMLSVKAQRPSGYRKKYESVVEVRGRSCDVPQPSSRRRPSLTDVTAFGLESSLSGSKETSAGAFSQQASETQVVPKNWRR